MRSTVYQDCEFKHVYELSNHVYHMVKGWVNMHQLRPYYVYTNIYTFAKAKAFNTRRYTNKLRFFYEPFQ